MVEMRVRRVDSNLTLILDPNDLATAVISRISNYTEGNVEIVPHFENQSIPIRQIWPPGTKEQGEESPFTGCRMRPGRGSISASVSMPDSDPFQAIARAEGVSVGMLQRRAVSSAESELPIRE
jgi:hypothetical protein